MMLCRVCLSPNEPIITKVGGKRVLAFYVPEDGGYAVNAVVWDSDDVAYPSTRVRMKLNQGQIFHIEMKLNQGQIFHIDGLGTESIHIQCEDKASGLRVVDVTE
jgi:hypothetical protein